MEDNLKRRVILMKVTLSVLVALLLLCGCGSPAVPEKYLGQQPPGMKPEIFAPGIVSATGFTEYSGSFSPDGLEYYFYRFGSNSPSALFCTMLLDGKWTTPEQCSFTGEYEASEPCVTADNSRLYFMWRKPVAEGQPGYGAEGRYYFVERTQTGWSEPVYAGEGMFMTCSWDGQIYTTDMSSRKITGQTYLAKVTTRGGIFTSFDRLDIQSYVGLQAHPCIALDGSYILFDVNGGCYLFVSFKSTDGTWGKPVDLTKHGFSPLAGGATISPDGKYLFFNLDNDIWWVDIKAVERLKP